MGQKVHPTGMRLGIIKKHNANWYAKGKDYPRFLNEDLKVREHIGTKLKFSSISKVELDRSAQAYVVNIHSSRPGIIIGKKGEVTRQRWTSANICCHWNSLSTPGLIT